jgi:hypothetical protein
VSAGVNREMKKTGFHGLLGRSHPTTGLEVPSPNGGPRKTFHGSKIGTAPASYAIKELVEKGFIEITRASGFNVKDRKRQATEYRLTRYADPRL